MSAHDDALPVVVCASGLHATLRAIDALQYAPDADAGGGTMSEAKCSIHLNVGGVLYGCVLPGGHAGPHDFRTAARPAPETREPDGWVVDAPESLPSHVAKRVVYWGPDAKRRANNRVQRLAEVFRAFAVANPVYLGAPAPAEATTRERKALDEIWEVASMADQSDPAFSAWGALETIAEIVRGFDEVEDQCDECGVMCSQGEGGTTFTVCDACWDKLHGAAEAAEADSPKWAARRIAELAERDFERVNTPAAEATERSES